MPEGHSVHRIARQFASSFTGAPVAVSSPQGRFAADAAKIDGHELIQAKAVGKQMWLEFDNELWLHVHLGMYGAWDFAGEIVTDAARIGQGREGQAREGTVVGAHEDSPWSIGAPRRTRLRMAESEKLEPDIETFPPEPIGQVRVRLLTPTAVADLRGPTVCEVQTIEQVDATVAKLGPDPLVDDPAEAEERFVATVRKKAVPIALLLMDQSVVSGIGNVYRAEMLFRARLDPFKLGKDVPEGLARALWRDWAYLLNLGVSTGQMLTMDDLDPEAMAKALANRDDRHWVYHRTGEPCRVCGTPIAMQELSGRKLYWCPKDQS
jgi:formamidopyrimidine-DNA glycosylase